MNKNSIQFESYRMTSCFFFRLIYAVFAFLFLSLSVSATTLNPIADSYVRNNTGADINYGSAVDLNIRGNGAAWRTAFMKFDISEVSGTVTNATLRIYANASGSLQTTGVFSVSDTSWTEGGITWNNQPTIGSLLDDVQISSTNYAWYELDVTSYLASQVSASSSLITLCLDNTDDAVSVNKVRSIEAGVSQWPQLVITLAVLSAPSISVQPADLTIDYGVNAVFSVTASGNPSPTYQWRKNGTALIGAVSSHYVIPNGQDEDAGDYDVVVTNSEGTVTSTVGTLDFNPALVPLIDEDFTSSATDFTEVSGGVWSVSGGRYVLSSPVTSGVGAGLLGNISVNDAVMMGDYSISTLVNVTGTASVWNDVALVFGYQDEDNYYYVSLNESNDGNTKGLFKVVGGSPTEVVDLGGLSVTSDTDYAIDVERGGSSITVDINASQVASITDSTFVGGKVGYGSKNDSGEFDDLIVYGVIGASQVETPVFSLAGGTYSSTQTVSISSPTSGSSIRYTTDGSTPTSTTGTLYTGAISVSSTTTLRAIAYKSGLTNSAINSATYTIILGTVSTPLFSPVGGSYVSAQSVSISSSTSGATIRYTTDGSMPTSTSGTIYSSAISVSSTTTLKAIAYKSGMNDSSVATATYTITGPIKPSPSNTGPSGSLTASGGLTISTNGAVIENLDISGTVYVQANNVTIRNCRIAVTTDFYGVQCTYGYTGVLIEDCEITGMRSSGIYGSNFTARRCYIHDSGADAFKPTENFVIESCYVTDLGYIEMAHADGIQMNLGSNGLLRWNTFDMKPEEDDYRNSICIFISTANGPIDNVVIDGNWINGGGWSIQIRDKGRGYGVPTNVAITNNKFGRDHLFGIFVADGPITASGNVWEDTGAPAP